MTSTAQFWNSEQLRAIARWYGASQLDPSQPSDEAPVLAIDPNSTHGRALRTLQGLFESNIEPKDAAEDLASHIFASEDTTESWSKMLSAVCSASEFLDRPRLFRLADLMVELSKMPRTLPSHPYSPGDNSSTNFADGLLFAELPGFGFMLREAIQAPTQYLDRLEEVTVEARNAARDRWCNASSFLAILTNYSYREILPPTMDFAWLGLYDITVALEGKIAHGEVTDQSTRLYRELSMEKKPSLRIPAAAMWIILAGGELLQFSAGQTRKAGSLWAETRRAMVPKPPSSEYSVERWSFWSQRLTEIADSDVFSLDLTAACDEAACKITAILEETTYL